MSSKQYISRRPTTMMRYHHKLTFFFPEFQVSSKPIRFRRSWGQASWSKKDQPQQRRHQVH